MKLEEQSPLQFFIVNVVRQIGLLDLAELEELQKSSSASVSRWDSIGHIMDPTAYRDYLQSGMKDSADIQAEILDHVIEIRRLINKHEGLRNSLTEED